MIILLLTWLNAPVEYPTHYFSAVESSTNGVQWVEVVRVPYALTNAVTVTNSQPGCLFRIVNGIK